jgi:hypothetical protein
VNDSITLDDTECQPEKACSLHLLLCVLVYGGDVRRVQLRLIGHVSRGLRDPQNDEREGHAFSTSAALSPSHENERIWRVGRILSLFIITRLSMFISVPFRWFGLISEPAKVSLR